MVFLLITLLAFEARSLPHEGHRGHPGLAAGAGVGRYEQPFRDNEIVAQVLRKLTADDLEEIGVAAVGHRRKLLDRLTAKWQGPRAGPSHHANWMHLCSATAMHCLSAVDSTRQAAGSVPGYGSGVNSWTRLLKARVMRSPEP